MGTALGSVFFQAGQQCVTWRREERVDVPGSEVPAGDERISRRAKHQRRVTWRPPSRDVRHGDAVDEVGHVEVHDHLALVGHHRGLPQRLAADAAQLGVRNRYGAL